MGRNRQEDRAAKVPTLEQEEVQWEKYLEQEEVQWEDELGEEWQE